ncbi:hypothetical protein [Aeoliella mucimassa]|uniref:Uncharacterized protein n=1 Tax=Aeoliella mucimassa TaxID=2527972 RepID=A0A518AWP0_9BACT|nr:hypothetical protein [Aeoliella mucimassa]QDU59100.1 hypothetical protein Pan181_53410 [Aeoliella mucimassa]
MQLQELLEVAGLLASNARWLANEQPSLDEQSIVDYWVASRCRFDRWGYDLRTYAKAAEKSDSRPLTPRLYRLASEIEVSEVLARTLAALGYAHDTAAGRQDTAPITTNILAGHRDITKRLNGLIANRDDTAFRDVVRFRDLRSKLRSLTDELVACYLPFAQVAPFAHDPRQVVKHGQRAASRVARGGESADWSTLRGTIATFRNLCNEYGPNNEENHRVAAAAMGFFAPELFDSYGLLRSTWLRRLERVEGETSVLLDEWMATEVSANPQPVNRIAEL